MKVGDLVQKKYNKELGILLAIQRSYEVDPNVCRFYVMWCRRGFNWECLDDFEVVNESR